MKKIRTHYDNLQVAENASPEVIKGAYKYLSQKWHPDKHPENRERAERITRLLNHAYRTLSDPERRRAHDEWIRQQRDQASHDHTDTNTGTSSPQADSNADDHAADSHRTTRTTRKQKVVAEPHHPWRRFFARSVDLALIFPIIQGLLLTLLYALAPNDAAEIDRLLSQSYLSRFLLFCALWIPTEAAMISWTGTTPAKSLFGIRVVNDNGRNLTYREALHRTVLLWVQGMAFGLPVLNLFAHLAGYMILTRSGTTPWDKSSGATVSHTQWGLGRVVALTASVLALFAISEAFVQAWSLDETVFQRQSDTDVANTADEQIWVENRCGDPIEFAVAYKDMEDTWRAVGWWRFETGGAAVLQEVDGTPLTTSSETWYYYAQSLAEPTVEWDGRHTFRVDGEELGMTKATLLQSANTPTPICGETTSK